MISESNEVLERGKCDPAWVTKERMKGVFIGLLFDGLVVLCSIWIIADPKVDKQIFAIIFLPILTIIFLIVVIVAWIYSGMYAKTFKYEITDQFILINRGVITRHKTTIPFSRIQNVSSIQGPFDRKFGLYTVKIETAGISGGDGGKMVPEGLVMGIKDPEKMEVLIKTLVNQYTQGGLISEGVKDKIFLENDLAFDQFIAYIFSKMREGDDVNNKIKELREKANFSQQDLAEKVDVTRQTIYYLERGTYNPSLKLAMKIARVFNVSIEELFELDENDIDE